MSIKVYNGLFCGYCKSKLDVLKIHHCLTFVNGLPTEGENHMKEFSDLKNIEAKTN